MEQIAKQDACGQASQGDYGGGYSAPQGEVYKVRRARLDVEKCMIWGAECKRAWQSQGEQSGLGLTRDMHCVNWHVSGSSCGSRCCCAEHMKHGQHGHAHECATAHQYLLAKKSSTSTLQKYNQTYQECSMYQSMPGNHLGTLPHGLDLHRYRHEPCKGLSLAPLFQLAPNWRTLDSSGWNPEHL